MITNNTAATVKFSKISLGNLVNMTNQDLTYDGGCMTSICARQDLQDHAEPVAEQGGACLGHAQFDGHRYRQSAARADHGDDHCAESQRESIGLSFGSETVGDTTTAKTVTLSNPGIGSLTISGLTITGSDAADFLVTSNTCGGSLAAGSNSSCTISVSFKPKAKGSRSATLKITDNAQSRTQTVSLSGTGH